MAQRTQVGQAQEATKGKAPYPLNDTFVRQVKPTGRAVGDKYSDGGGLHLLVKASGKYWRLAYRFAGKQKTLACGTYPEVTLKQARQRREDARALLADGADPGVTLSKRAVTQASRLAAGNTFEAVAREYHALKSKGWSPKYARKWLTGLENYMFRPFGNRPIDSIKPAEVLDVLRLVEKRGIIDAAHTLRQNAGQVFRYAVQTSRAERNPVVDLEGALKPLIVKHMAAILEPVEVGGLLRAIDGYTGHPLTRGALLLSALTFQRPGNIRQAEWAEIDFDKALWTIPAAKMKRTMHGKLNGRPHFVPLAPQAIEVLREMQALSGAGRYVFPSLLTGERPMSDNTVNTALRRMGYTKEMMTAHGFRAMARTLLVEHVHGVQAEVIEAQLAHGKNGPLGEAYDRAAFMQQRRVLMTQWADYLDKLRVGADVVPISKAA